MKPTLLLALGLACAGLLPCGALGQPAGAVSKAVAPLESIRRDAVVRLSTDGRYTVGRFTRVTIDSLYLVATAGVPVASLDSVWVQGRATRNGAVLGGILVGLPFTAIGFALAGLGCERSEPCSAGGVVVATAAVGVISGALLGAALGSLGHVWQRVHP